MATVVEGDLKAPVSIATISNIWGVLLLSLTENDINTQLTKVWTAIDRLSIIWKSDLTDKIKCIFFQRGVHVDTAIRMHSMDPNKTYVEKPERQLHKNATSYIEDRGMQRLEFKSWKQHPTKQ